MATTSKTCDVFISHSTGDAGFARKVADACRAGELEAVTAGDLLAADPGGDALWEALAESRAFVVIVSAESPTPAMGVEIGAARAWNKPMFAIATDAAHSRLPTALSGTTLYTSGRIDDVIQAIKHSEQELSDEDRAAVAAIYEEIGTSVDQLALDPRYLQTLVKKFKAETRRNVAGERLLSELLRMRKQGRLRRTPVARTKPKRKTA